MRLIIVSVLLLTFACKSTETQMRNVEKSRPFEPQYIPGPSTFVYKTKGDYYNLVPIILSDDKTQVISYPHPRDLIIGGDLSLPVMLYEGYLLDNRGINRNVAFISLTYYEYSKLANPPSASELLELIVDNDPLTELCDCGNRDVFTDPEKQLNEAISNKILRKICTVIK